MFPVIHVMHDYICTHVIHNDRHHRNLGGDAMTAASEIVLATFISLVPCTQPHAQQLA